MGNLIFQTIPQKFEDLPVSDREVILEDFIYALDSIRLAKDSISITDDTISDCNDFFANIFMVNYADSRITGVKRIILELFRTFGYKSPYFYTSSFPNSADFFTHFRESLTGVLSFSGIYKGDVYCEKSHLTWKLREFTDYELAFDWTSTVDDHGFFPLPFLIYKILRREIEKFPTEKILDVEKIDLKANYLPRVNWKPVIKSVLKELAIFFHDEVLRKKGPETGAYSLTLGNEILESNGYRFEAELSSRVKEDASGSKRKIYSILKNGENQFVSIDFKHGMFELHNSKGEHLGESKFDGSYNSGPEASHNFNV
jgi:hypothetical protein